MRDFDRQPRWTSEEFEASAVAKMLRDRSHAGDELIHLGYPQAVEDQLSGSWHKEGYAGVAVFIERKLSELMRDRSGLTMFVDADCMPIAVARLEEQEENQDVRYRFFVDGSTYEVALPRTLTGPVSNDYRDDLILYDLSDEEILPRNERGEVEESIMWLRERLGKKLTSKSSQLQPYLANEDGIVAVRLDVIAPEFDGDYSRNPARF